MNNFLFWIVRLCIIGIVFAPLILSPHTVFPFVVGKSLWIRSLIIIAVTAFCVLAFRKSEFRPKLSKILIIFGFFILINFISAIYGLSPTKSFWSTWERMDGVIELIFWFLIFVVAVSTFRSLEDWKVLFKVNICVGFVVAILSIGQLFNIDFTFLSFLPLTVMYLGQEEVYTVGRLTSTVGNPTFLGPYLAIVVIMAVVFLYERFFSFYKFIAENDTRWKMDLVLTVSLFLGILLSLWVIILTGSRGTLLGLASSFFLVLILFFFTSKNIWVKFLSGFTLVGIISSLFLVIWMHNHIKSNAYVENEKLLEDFIGENIYINYIRAPSKIVKAQEHFDSFLSMPEQEKLLSDSFKKLLNKSGGDEKSVTINQCDRDYLFLRNLSPVYFNGMNNPDAETREALFDEDLKIFEKSLVKNRDAAILMDDGNLYYHFLNGIFPGGQPECGKLFLFLKSIHPSLAYLINEGIQLKSRSLGWSQAWSGFKERPLLGWGPENFDLIFFKYLKGTDYEGYPPAKFDRAHSRPFDVLVNTGVLGFIVWAVFWVVLFFSVFRNIFRRDNFTINLMIASCLTTYFVSSLFLFPQSTWYVQFFILVGVISRSNLGFLPRVNLNEVITKKKKRRRNDETNMGVMIVTLISPILGIGIFYWLIITPYHVASNTLPITNSKTLDQLQEIAGRFEPLASYGRLEILNRITNNLNEISKTATKEQMDMIVQNTSILASSLLEDEPENFLLHQALFNFYFNLSRLDDSFLKKSQEHAEKLIELSPEHINAQESMIRLALVRRDFQEAKKWVDKWKQDHIKLQFQDIIFWDDFLLELEIENQK